MKRQMGWNHVAAWFAAAALYAAPAMAQQKAENAAELARRYDVGREVSVQGTVVSYTESSPVPPLGPHVVVQTASGQVDVHLGNAKLLQANQMTLATGDSIRVIGENVTYSAGTQFFARILQKGNQVVAVRSVRGFPLRPVSKSDKTQAGAL